MGESPTSIDKLGLMSHEERLIYGVDESPEMRSRLHTWETLQQLPFQLVEETEPFSTLDAAGIDLVGKLGQPLASLTGLEDVTVQIKSSEAGISHLIESGERHGLFPFWSEEKLLVVNGGMSAEVRAADVMHQIMHYAGIEPGSLREAAVLEQCHPAIKDAVQSVPAEALSCREEWYEHLG